MAKTREQLRQEALQELARRELAARGESPPTERPSMLSMGQQFFERYAPLPVRLAAGVAETGLQAGTTGGIAPVAGLAGIGAGSLTPGTPTERLRTAAETVQNIQNRVGYRPRTELGQQISNLGQTGLEQYARFARGVGTASDPTGQYPVGQGLVESAVLAAPALMAMRIGGRQTPRPTRRQVVLESANRRGLVAPPASATQSGTVSAVEGLGGKVMTQRQAAFRNQPVFDRMAADEIGLPQGRELSRAAIADVRRTAGQQYNAARGAGIITLGRNFARSIEDAVRSFRNMSRKAPTLSDSKILRIADELKKNQAMDASEVVDAIQRTRELASEQYDAGTPGLGKAYRSMAEALENELQAHLSGDVLRQFQDARQLIAKAHSVEDAMKGEHVDAQSLARALDNGEPLSGQLREIGQFAQEFPKASQLLRESITNYSPLDAAYQMASLAAAAVSQNPVMAIPAVYSLSRPFIRNFMLSRMGQQMAQPRPGPAMTVNPAGVTTSGMFGIYQNPENNQTPQ